MAELVDALVSNTSGRKAVPVRPRLWVQKRKKEIFDLGLPFFVIHQYSEIIHITSLVYDERKGEAYAKLLDIYSSWLISNRHSKGWNVIDIHWTMKKKLEDYRKVDSTFVFAKDGVHPNETVHFEMAKQIIYVLI